MSAYQNTAAIEGYIRATNAREPIDWYLGPGYVYHGPMGDLDRDGFVRQHDDFLTAFPDAVMTILDVTSEDDKVVIRWMAEATHEASSRDRCFVLATACVSPCSSSARKRTNMSGRTATTAS